MIYYISENGSNANPGTRTQPWRDMQYAKGQINKGDRINGSIIRE